MAISGIGNMAMGGLEGYTALKNNKKG
jgi:hypothetical protein